MGSTPGVYRPKYKGKDGVRRETKTWMAAWWDAGTGSVRREYGFRTAKDAQARRAAMMASGAANSVTLTLRQMLDLVVDDYKLRGLRSARMNTQRCNQLCESIGASRPVRTINEKVIEEHVAWLRKQELAVATINRSLACLKRGFRLASRKHRGVHVPHIPLFNESGNVRQGFFAVDEMERIIAHLAPHARPVVRTLHVTGWRVGEILSRKWSDIEDGFLLIRPGQKSKTGRPRAWPIEPDLEVIFKDLPRDSEWIFTYRRPKPKEKDRPQEYYPPEPILSITKTWNTARKAAGLRHRLMHDFRRTAVRDLVRSHVDRGTAKRLVGHVTDSIFERYQIIDSADLKAAAAQLSKHRHSA